MPVEIIKIHQAIKSLDPYTLDEHRTVVLESEDLYPGIDLWYDRKARLGLEKGERIGYLVKKDGVSVGAAIAKQGENAKICTVRVRDEAIHEGIGKVLFLAMAMNLRRDTKKVHFTAPEDLWNRYRSFFEEMGFVMQGNASEQYRLFDPEIVATADYKQFRRATFDHYLPEYARDLAQIAGQKVDMILSVKSEYARKIANRTKTVELRRKFSKKWIGSWALIYSSMPDQSFVAAAQILNIIKDHPASIWNQWHDAIGCKEEEFYCYTKNLDEIFGVIFGMVKAIDPIPKSQLEHLLQQKLIPPQSYCDVANNPIWGSAVGISHMLQNNI
jgi:predicted transcriptional regulator/N-acetylglutamate synthase-like GNAT family acetyltransferase